MTIRTADPGDAVKVHAIAQRAYEKYVERIGTRPWPMDEDYAGKIAVGQVHVFDREGSVVGFLVLVRDGECLLVDNLAVDPEHQEGGVGSALLEHAEAQARELGIGGLRLYTNEKMTENLAFYPRRGYRLVGRERVDRFIRVLFEKQLD